MQTIFGPWLVSLKHCVYLSMLLSSPERIPYHPQTIVLNILSYFALGLLLANEDLSYSRICAQVILQLMMMAIITQAFLARNHRQSRFVQTYSALTGVTLLIDAIAILIHLHILNQPEMTKTTLMWAGFIILFWNLAVLSLIFHRAFETSTGTSALISISYVITYHLFAFWLLT